MHHRGRALVLTLLMSASFLSCGDDDDAGSCAAFTPCGGDVVGTWSIQNMCLTGGAADLIEGCPAATLSLDGIKGSGTITFNPNMTTTENITISGAMTLTVPTSCFMGATCAQIDAGFRTALLNDPETPFSAVSCSGSGPCSCRMTFKDTPATTEMDTYMISGNKIIDGDGEAQEYCVSGKTMNVRSTMPMAGMMEDLAFTMTLQKQ